MVPRSRHHRPCQEPPASIRHRHKVFKKGQATARGLDKPPRSPPSPISPPLPAGKASRPLSSGVQAARRFACFSCPLPVSVGRSRASRVRFALRVAVSSPSAAGRASHPYGP
ncbi:hypothetical protein J4732_15275 [Serratia marcescens]|uniref:Uncharacterized protein n=1 Tax=Serratia marcescens TaxID=615 RepID=A0A939NT64_SERMA|nr:hypothetical protein [Serratia marcescens]